MLDALARNCRRHIGARLTGYGDSQLAMDTNDPIPNNRTAPLPRAFLPALLFSCALVLVAGLWQTHRLVHMADRHMRENLLLVAASLGQNLTPESIQKLSFTKADLQNTAFKRLKRQLAAASEHLELAGVFTVARRDGKFVFGVESYPDGHPYATQPGTQYQRPPDQVAAVFATRQPQVTPLYTDEFGQFITALAPVIDPLTGEVMLAVCCDMDVEQWRRLIHNVRGWSLGFTALILILLLSSFFLFALRLRRPMPSRWYLRYSEALLCAGFMLTLTVAAVWFIRFRESRVRESSFSALAQQQASAITREFYGIRRSIDGLAGIFQASTGVSPAEFALYASRFTADYAIQAALWTPAVESAAVSRVEAEARAEGFSHYQVWQPVPDMPGERMPAAGRPTFYPIRYLEPQSGHQGALGFDLGSEPSRAAALHETLRTGLVSASDLVSFFAISNAPPGFFVMQATASQTQTGVIALAVCIDPLLRVPLNRVAARPGQGLVADLFQLSLGQPPAFLTTSLPDHMTGSGCLPPSEPRLKLTVPVFAFGKTFVVVIHSTPAWLAANPLRDSMTAAVAGLLLTAVMTVFVVFLSSRRIALEREIRNRTADLMIAHDNLKSIFSATPVAMMVVDRETRILDANQRAEDLFNSKVCECVNEGCGVFLSCVKRHAASGGCGHGPDCSLCPLRQAIKEVSDGGQSVYDRDMETRVDRAGKTETFHIRFSAAPVRYANRQRVVVALHDITFWHRTEQLYRTLFLEMDYGMVLYEQVTDGKGRITDFRYTTANPAYERFTGRSADSLTGKTLLSMRPDCPADLFAAFVRVTEGGQASRFSFHDKARNRHYEGTLFRFESGQLANIFTDVTDRIQADERLNSAAEETRRLLKETEAARCELLSAVEEQKRTDEALVHERNLLYALMDNLPDRIYFKDIESRFLKISKAHAASLGLASPEEAIGKSDANFKPAEVAGRTRAKELEIIKTGLPLLAQVEQKQTDDGRIHWVSASKAPIKDKEGHVVGLVGISRDITPEIELQQQLQQVYKMDAIGRLAGGVAHDFNNLLQAILGFTEILLAGVAEQDAQYGDLKQIERAAKRAADLTRQLLAFSRKQRVTPQVLNINHIISSTEKMLHRLMGEGIEIIQKLDPDVLSVRADPNQIEQIIVNLAVNARDSMPQGGRLIFSTDTFELKPADAEAIPEAIPGLFTRLSVSDTGTGISPDMLPHLFEPFFTSKAQGKGTGLGLSVIYGIVKQNGGWINVDSREGRGTTFNIFLPARNETPEAPDAGSLGQASITLQGLGKSILLVEDEPGVRSLAALVLQGAGYKVCACESAQEAKAFFAHKDAHFDLLFSDVVLVGQNGIDLALELRTKCPTLPVLLCSGYADDSVRWESIQHECFHFLPKPYPTAKLLSSVRDALTTHQ